MTDTQLLEPPLTGSVFNAFEIRDLESDSKLTRLAGMAVPYGKPADVGLFTEEFTRGAFARSIQGAAKSLPLLLFHNDRGWPIGVSEEWRDRPDGLHGVWRLDDGEDAQRAARMARDGMLSYLSVRFQQVGGKYRASMGPEKPHFSRQEARLIETSLTSTPVYIDSTVAWVRSQPDAEVISGGGNNHERAAWDMYLREIKQGVPYTP